MKQNVYIQKKKINVSHLSFTNICMIETLLCPSLCVCQNELENQPSWLWRHCTVLQKHHPAFPRLPVGSLTGGSDADFRGEPSGGCRLGAILCFANARWQNVHQASVLMKKKSFSCEVLFVLITGMLLNNAKKILAQLFSPTTHSLANQVFPSTGVLYQ